MLSMGHSALERIQSLGSFASFQGITGGWCQNLVHGSGIETKKYDEQCTSNRIKQRKTAGYKMTNQTVRWMETITQLQAVEVWPCGHN